MRGIGCENELEMVSIAQAIPMLTTEYKQMARLYCSLSVRLGALEWRLLSTARDDCNGFSPAENTFRIFAAKTDRDNHTFKPDQDTLVG